MILRFYGLVKKLIPLHEFMDVDHFGCFACRVKTINSAGIFVSPPGQSGSGNVTFQLLIEASGFVEDNEGGIVKGAGAGLFCRFGCHEWSFFKPAKLKLLQNPLTH